MAVQKIDPNASQEDIIDTLNNNFQTLTERIKNNNINISFLDLLRLDTVWSKSWSGTSADSRRQDFISTVWNTLANYSGVFIQYTASGTEAAFDFGGAVNNGDYLVKLPGAQFIHIPGQDANYYKPTGFNYSNGSIDYTLATTTLPTVNITFSTAAASGLTVTTGTCSANSSFTVPTGKTLRNVRWSYNGEEVLWSNSYNTNMNSSGDTLNYIACYQ